MDKQMIEEIAKDVAFAGQIAGDWLMEESRKLLQEKGRFKSTEHTKTLSDIVAEELAKMGYRKIPDGVVVLTREEYDDMFSFKTTRGGFYNILDTVRKVERKETAEKFAEMLKAEYDAIGKELQQSYDEVFGSDLPEWSVPDVVYSYGYIDKIGEICKEIIGGTDDDTSEAGK